MSQLDPKTQFEEIYVHFYTPIRMYVYGMTKNMTLTDDLTQETFLKAYAARERFTPGSVSAWLRRIAYTSTITHFRRHEERYTEELLELHAKDEEGYASVEDRQLVSQLLEKLKPQQRRLIVLYYLKDFSREECAKRMNLDVSDKSIYFRLRRALNKMQEASA